MVPREPRGIHPSNGTNRRTGTTTGQTFTSGPRPRSLGFYPPIVKVSDRTSTSRNLRNALLPRADSSLSGSAYNAHLELIDWSPSHQGDFHRPAPIASQFKCLDCIGQRKILSAWVSHRSNLVTTHPRPNGTHPQT